jgi:pilus assembly protein Flp/PilA
VPFVDSIDPRHCAAFQKTVIEEKHMKNLMKFIRDEEGLTTVEYAIAGGLVGAGVIGAFAALGDEVFRVINAIVLALTNITIT